MARRTGKAGSRRSTRRSRVAPRRPSIPAPPPSSPAATEDAAPITRVEPRKPAVSEAPTIRGPAYVSSSTALGERARLEYHYVGRDLRNIVVLTAIMAVLLLIAWLVLPAVGLVSR